MLMRTYKTVKIEISPPNKSYKMSDNQSIFDILNLNYTFWYGKPKPSNELDPDKRHYQCVENSEIKFYPVNHFLLLEVNR